MGETRLSTVEAYKFHEIFDLNDLLVGERLDLLGQIAGGCIHRDPNRSSVEGFYTISGADDVATRPLSAPDFLARLYLSFLRRRTLIFILRRKPGDAPVDNRLISDVFRQTIFSAKTIVTAVTISLR